MYGVHMCTYPEIRRKGNRRSRTVLAQLRLGGTISGAGPGKPVREQAHAAVALQ